MLDVTFELYINGVIAITILTLPCVRAAASLPPDNAVSPRPCEYLQGTGSLGDPDERDWNFIRFMAVEWAKASWVFSPLLNS